MILVKITLVFILLVLLLRLKIPFAFSIILMALVVGMSFNLGFNRMPQLAMAAISDVETLNLIAIVGLVLAFSELASRSGQLMRLSDDLVNLFGAGRITLIALPMLIGLLPMPGGALFSAPLMEDAGRQISIPAHKKTLLNYWFRHIWEYAWPLYPALVLAAGLTGTQLFRLCLFQSPLTVCALISGMIIIFPGVKVGDLADRANGGQRLSLIGRLLLSLLPFISVVVLFLAFQFSMIICLLSGLCLVIARVLIGRQMSLKGILKTVFGKWSVYEMMLMVASVMFFVNVLQSSTLTAELTDFFTAGTGREIPFVYTVIAMLTFPFIVGFLAGMTTAVIGTTFPIIIAIFIPASAGGNLLPYALLCYSSGLAGVMLSPMHLCLILTNKYFGSELRRVYAYLIPIVLLTWTGAVCLFWLYIL